MNGIIPSITSYAENADTPYDTGLSRAFMEQIFAPIEDVENTTIFNRDHPEGKRIGDMTAAERIKLSEALIRGDCSD